MYRSKEIVEAFCDIVDGMPAHEIRTITGLSWERCTEIYNLYIDFYNHYNNTDIPFFTYDPDGNSWLK